MMFSIRYRPKYSSKVFPLVAFYPDSLASVSITGLLKELIEQGMVSEDSDVLTLFFGIFIFFDFDATLSFSTSTFRSEGLTASNAKKNPIINSFLDSTY